MILTIHKHIVTRIPRFSVSYDNHKTWLLHITNVEEEDRGILQNYSNQQYLKP